MKVLVTGVKGQLGHDVMNRLAQLGHEALGTDITPEYSGAQDGTVVTNLPYFRLDITDQKSVSEILEQLRPDAARSDAAHQGLGLYFARKVAQSHGGVLVLSNLPAAHGACAELRLPICE